MTFVSLMTSCVLSGLPYPSGKGHLALAVFRCFSCPRASWDIPRHPRMSQDALGQLKHLKTAKARWPFPDVEKLPGSWNYRLSSQRCSACIPWSCAQPRMSGSLVSSVCQRRWSRRLRRMWKNIRLFEWTCISRPPVNAVSLASTYRRTLPFPWPWQACVFWWVVPFLDGGVES